MYTWYDTEILEILQNKIIYLYVLEGKKSKSFSTY